MNYGSRFGPDVDTDGLNGKTSFRVGMFGTCTDETVAMLTPAKIGPIQWSNHMTANHLWSTKV
jgi:hypothetical protein